MIPSCPVCLYKPDKWYAWCPKCGKPYAFGLKPVEIKKQDQNSLLIDSRNIRTVIVKRLQTELIDSILYGGIAKGSTDLWYGEPGCGKTTLAIQCAGNLRRQGKRPVILEAEELLDIQRGRLKKYSALESAYSSGIKFVDKNRVMQFLKQGRALRGQYDIIFVDSANEIKIAANLLERIKLLVNFSHVANMSVVMLAHVNKQNKISGAKAIEHVVDGVLQFSVPKKNITEVTVKKGRFYELRAKQRLFLDNNIGFIIPPKADDEKGEVDENNINTNPV